MWMPRFLAALLGLNPDLPYADEVANPVDGQKAKNHRRQKVIYDQKQGKWVMPQNYSGRRPVTITKG